MAASVCKLGGPHYPTINYARRGGVTSSGPTSGRRKRPSNRG